MSLNCKKSDHDNCSIDLNNNNKKCECSCHRFNSITRESLQDEEKDKHGITRQDELMAETLP
jgi:hypothetical protein